EPRTLNHLPHDQPDQHECAERGDPRGALQNQVAEAHPPPLERAAGCVGADVERGHERAALSRYEWIFLICFVSKALTAFGIGTNMSAGPYDWPFEIAQPRSFLMSRALAPADFCTSTYVYVQIG